MIKNQGFLGGCLVWFVWFSSLAKANAARMREVLPIPCGVGDATLGLGGFDFGKAQAATTLTVHRITGVGEVRV